MNELKAPFPYFGGKSRVAHQVWQRLGDVPNFIEPFFGSGAVLLARPDSHNWRDRTETVNDKDGLVSNFWRAVTSDSEAVAHYADQPVHECDLHARHAWLMGQKESLQSQLEGDPDYYDAKIAGWWCWGLCCWIGGGFCSGQGPWHVVDGELVKTENDGTGTKRQRIHLGMGRGVNRQLPHLGAGQGVNRKQITITDWFIALQQRLRRVRVCCGDWSRICGPSPTYLHGVTGVFLDPPYDQSIRDDQLYRVEDDVSEAVRVWAIQLGENPLMRIALCGYEGEHNMPASWTKLAWKASGGYAKLGDGSNINATLERIWFSPHCLTVGSTQTKMEGI